MRWPALCCALGALFLSLGNVWFAVAAANGSLPAALVAGGAVCALVAALSNRDGERLLFAQMIFAVGFLRGLFWLFFEQTLVPAARLQGVHGLALSGLIIGAAFLCVHLRASFEKARLWLLFVLFAVIALAMDAPVLPVAAALVTAVAIARCGTRPTADLAAIFLLFSPGTFDGLVRSSPAILVAPVVALTVMAASRFSASARGTAALAAVAAACAFLPGHTADAAFVATTLVCAAAAGFSRNPACSARAARVKAVATRP